MAKFVLTHRHSPQECPVAFAAWRGFQSPLRHVATPATCAISSATGRHLIWWTVEAADEQAALAQLPPYLVEGTEVRQVSEVAIP